MSQVTSRTTITKKWQLHIPVKIRKELNLNKPTTARISTKNGKIIITPEPTATGFMKLAGSLHQEYKNNPIDIDNIRDYIDYSKA